MGDKVKETVALLCFGSTCVHRRVDHYKYVTDHRYPVMKHFYPCGFGLFQNNNVSIHRLTEWFDEGENQMLQSHIIPNWKPMEDSGPTW